MSARDTILELLDRDPFEPFRVLTSGSESFVIHDPHSVALLKSEVFIAQPNSERRTYFPLLHVAAVDTLRNGTGSRARRKRRQ